MENILSHLDVLQTLLSKKPILVFDYDGTLAPLVDDPKKAKMNGSTKILFRKVAEKIPCAVVTGRASKSIRPFLKGVPLRMLVGNHGLEGPAGIGMSLADKKKAERLVKKWTPPLHRVAKELGRVWVESKKVSITVHFRTEKKSAYRRMRREISRLGGAHIIPGKNVLNLMPLGHIDKGTAVVKLMRKKHFSAALYAGDDVTDERVFRIARKNAILGVRIGRKPSSARYYLPDGAIDKLLLNVLTLRKRLETL